ncbi:MAG: FAD binding domain-containing protein [Lautropia sp.]|nr:FAD binding domain-containing protein [Lautropia sp.]
MTQALFNRPRSIAEAIALLADPSATPLAGGTDYYAARVGRMPSGKLVDLSGIATIRGVAQQPDGGWRIGAGTTWRDLLAAALPPAFDGLKLAAREVGGVQVQNCGTVGGNLCNASPAADGVPPLLALDAVVELRGPDGARTLPLAEFITGPRRTARRPGELLTAVLVPAAAVRGGSHFAKLGARRYLLISIVMVAAGTEVDAQGRLARVAVAVGACSAVAQRLRVLERRLLGLAVIELAGLQIDAGDLEELDPIDDVRATRAYRLDAAAALVPRVLRASVAA